MPHKPKVPNQPTSKSEQSRLLFLQGTKVEITVANLDPKPEPFVQALLLLMAEGMTVYLKPGSGGRALGIGGWAGEDRVPYTWLYDEEEIDSWSAKVIRNLGAKYEEAAD